MHVFQSISVGLIPNGSHEWKALKWAGYGLSVDYTICWQTNVLTGSKFFQAVVSVVILVPRVSHHLSYFFTVPMREQSGSGLSGHTGS